MTNNNQVNWDEIPEDVEAVVTFELDVPTYFKGIAGNPLIQNYRHHGYEEITCVGIEYYKDTYGDRFHLRPSPITQPTPEPPESTQVEASEVEATTTPEFDWSSVEEDVEAVVLYPDNTPDFYKHIYSKLYVQFKRGEQYFRSDYDTVSEMFEDYDEGRILIRPLPETTTHDEPPSISTILQEAQQSILKYHGVTGRVKFTVACSSR